MRVILTYRIVFLIRPFQMTLMQEFYVFQSVQSFFFAYYCLDSSLRVYLQLNLYMILSPKNILDAYSQTHLMKNIELVCMASKSNQYISLTEFM